MEKNGHEKITAFDTLFTTNHIQMLKILMPYLEPPMQKQMAVYIKYLELRYAMSCLDSHPHELYGCAGGHNNPLGGSGPFAKEEFHIGKICSELIPYCTDEEKQRVEQLSGLFRSMEMYKEMSQTFEAMKEFMPDFSPDFLSGFMQNQTAAGSSAAARMENENPGEPDREKQGNGIMDMLMNMLSPEQKSMLEMFGGNHAHESE